jgi:hypothetical protein
LNFNIGIISHGKEEIPTSPKVKATLDMLQTSCRTLSLDKISEDTGLTKSWLAAFQAEQIDDPSFSKFEALWKYLDSNY